MFDIESGVDAAKKAVTNYAIPMIVGTFIVAVVLAFLKK